MATVDQVFDALLKAAPQNFGKAWTDVKGFLPTELHKISVQLVSIAENVAKFKADPSQGYPVATGKVLLKMQINATENVLVAVTVLTLIALEDTINAVIRAAKGVLGTIVDELI